jgi:O-antigen/teichoic acid export membrane protein
LGKNRILEYNLIFVSQPVLLALIFFAGIFLNIFTIQFAIYSWTISIIAVGIGSLFFYKDFSIKRPTYHIEAGKKSITFGLKSYFANLIQYLNLRFDYFLVNYFLSVKMVGIYSVSVAMAEILFHVPNAIGTILFSRVSNYSSEKANQDTPMICRNVLAFTVFSAIILTIIANYIFPVLFTNKYADSINPFIILLPGTLFLTISKILANDITGRGKPIVNMYIAILTFILNIVLNIILIPEYGILGAALASSITYSLSTFVLIFIFLKISKVSITDLFIIKKNDFKYYFKFFNTYLKGKKDL